MKKFMHFFQMRLWQLRMISHTFDATSTEIRSQILSFGSGGHVNNARPFAPSYPVSVSTMSDTGRKISMQSPQSMTTVPSRLHLKIATYPLFLWVHWQLLRVLDAGTSNTSRDISFIIISLLKLSRDMLWIVIKISTRQRSYFWTFRSGHSGSPLNFSSFVNWSSVRQLTRLKIGNFICGWITTVSVNAVVELRARSTPPLAPSSPFVLFNDRLEVFFVRIGVRCSAVMHLHRDSTD
jgi:hypothetical protein